jgi:hypothetical protein
VNDRDAFSDDPVEKRRFPDVGPANDCDQCSHIGSQCTANPNVKEKTYSCCIAEAPSVAAPMPVFVG